MTLINILWKALCDPPMNPAISNGPDPELRQFDIPPLTRAEQVYIYLVS